MRRILSILIIVILAVSAIVAQDDDENQTDCDTDNILATYNSYTTILQSFPTNYEDDPETALAQLYDVGLAFQNLALDCGLEPESLHSATIEDEQETMDYSEIEDIDELITSIGDPINGEALFVAFQPKTGFSCSTCHYTNSMDTLIGPGLVMVGNPYHQHNHAMHNEEHQAGSMGMMGQQEFDPESFMQQIEYIRTSILNPSDFVVPGFADNLMPQNYADVYSEEEINDIIAFLVSNSVEHSR